MINNKLYHRPKMNRNAHVGKVHGPYVSINTFCLLINVGLALEADQQILIRVRFTGKL